MFVTKQWLVEHDADEDQIEIFDKRWPDGVELTRDVLVEANSLKLVLGWFVEKLATPEANVEFDRDYDVAWRSYKSAIDLAWTARAVDGITQVAYREARDYAVDGFNKLCIDAMVKALGL